MEFAGFEITSDGFRPPARIIEAIKNFPKPEKVTDIRSWFGLVNQVAYTFYQAEVMEPFRELLSGKRRVWSCDETLTDIFNKSKEAIVEQFLEGVHNFSIKSHLPCHRLVKDGNWLYTFSETLSMQGTSRSWMWIWPLEACVVGSLFLKDAETR